MISPKHPCWRLWSRSHKHATDEHHPHFCDAYESVYCMCVYACVCVFVCVCVCVCVCVFVMEVYRHPQWKVLCQSNGKTETHVQLFGIFPEQLKDEDYCNGILHWRTVTPLFPIAVTHKRRQTWSHTQARRLTFSMHTHERDLRQTWQRAVKRNIRPETLEALKGYSSNLVLHLFHKFRRLERNIKSVICKNLVKNIIHKPKIKNLNYQEKMKNRLGTKRFMHTMCCRDIYWG